MESAGGASCGDLHVRHRLQLVSRLPDGVHKAVSRIRAPMRPSKALPVALPQGLLNPQLDSLRLSPLDGVRKKWVSGTVSRTPGEVRHSPSGSRLPPQNKSQTRKFFLDTERGRLGGVVTWVK